MFRGNVITSLLAVKHAGPPMIARGGGSIILMSSSGSLRANEGCVDPVDLLERLATA